MGFFSFLGRVLFAAFIIFSAWQMFIGFGVNGGPAAKVLALKLDLDKPHLSSKLWVTLSNIEVRQVGVTIVSLIAIGSLLFVIGKIFGAYLAFYFVVVSPVLYDLYNYGPEERRLSAFWIEVLKGATLYLLNRTKRSFTYHPVTPVYDSTKVTSFSLQKVANFGALYLYFLE